MGMPGVIHLAAELEFHRVVQQLLPQPDICGSFAAKFPRTRKIERFRAAYPERVSF